MKENSLLKKLLLEKEIVGLDLNSPERFAAHRTVLDRKPMIKNVFREFHHEFMRLDQEYFGNAEGLRVELGAGVFPMRETYPEVLATDVVPGEHFDMVVDAQNMRLDSGSVRAIYGQGCFHHFPEPSIFFRELSRVLASRRWCDSD